MVTTVSDTNNSSNTATAAFSTVPRYRNDLQTPDDRFSLGRVGDQIARMALEVEPPFTFGVTGKWGAGKTSAMRRAFATLGGQPMRQERTLATYGEESNREEWEEFAWGNKKRQAELIEQGWPDQYFDHADGIFCVWFSPWQHQQEDNLLVPLIREIRVRFEAKLQDRLDAWKGLPERTKKDKEGKEAKKKAWTRCRSNALAAIERLGHAGDVARSLAIGGRFPAIADAHGAAETVQEWREGKTKEIDLPEPGDGQRFHLLFEDAVDQVLETFLDLSKKGASFKRNEDFGEILSPRIVIFIDDADRCEDAVIVRLLEAIRLYLASRRCVFVLGLDGNAMLDALMRYRPGRPIDHNREYLEKLFQATLAMPLPSTAQVRKAITEQLTVHGIPYPQRLAEDIERLLEPNPRKIKNFINGFCAVWTLHDAARWLKEEGGSKIENSGEYTVEQERERAVRRFLIFQYLRAYHSPVWRLLERQPWSLAILGAVIEGVSDAEPLPLPEEIDRGQQRLLWEFYFRAFSHVLVHPEGTDPGEKEGERIRQGKVSLEEAVEHFQERQDRKRSDEYLCLLFRTLVPSGYQLNGRYLYLDTDGAPQPILIDKP
uniref:KAP family P-loop domain-containing protein n=1 Tax=Candidatus Kentrum sp. MB TaxID=2138164 RepID=A0A450XXD9_9GAMM|nr:MAG: KAP family P-loop domain-containing protein [Candidatus Kentron sp. MB]VFK76524.1 MAG: KAP family P-loop domain-containing protein [Candidatus Kentron sp. MB]